MCSRITCLHESSFLKNPLGSLCTPREVDPCTYVKQCFLTRSPSWTAQSTLDPTSWSKINPTHNSNHHHPKSVARKLLSSSIIFDVIYSQLMGTHTNYTGCFLFSNLFFLSSTAACYIKNKKTDFRESTITKCRKSLTPNTLFVASDSGLWQSVPTELVESSVTGLHLNKSSWSKEGVWQLLLLWCRDINKLNYHMDQHIKTCSNTMKVCKDRKVSKSFLTLVKGLFNNHLNKWF